MKILFPTWKSFGVEDIKETFEKLGHSVLLYKNEQRITELTQNINQK